MAVRSIEAQSTTLYYNSFSSISPGFDEAIYDLACSRLSSIASWSNISFSSISASKFKAVAAYIFIQKSCSFSFRLSTSTIPLRK